jgi:dTDP-4-amino-4,6-dideoxygalactose transaminase
MKWLARCLKSIAAPPILAVLARIPNKAVDSVVRIPFLQPQPARLSRLVRELEAIETSGIFSNYGPVNARFEAALTEQVFDSTGGCLTVNNATTGLILTMREAAGPMERGRYALMPSFTFAAAAHAALWAGLIPLLCDIDLETWNACPEAEDDLLRRYRGRIACVVPYACFGNCIDLERYERIARDERVGVVVDAAASLGSLDEHGRGFGAGFSHAIVYSMHVTKTFATAEGGVIHCGDLERLARLRVMGNFGFGRTREATLPGLNSKLSEIGALLALAKLETIESIVCHRAALAADYRQQLPGFGFQRTTGQRLAYQFMPVLLPSGCPVSRSAVLAALQNEGISAGHYFSPHLAEQPFFAATCVVGDLNVTQQIAPRILSLPMSDLMTRTDVSVVCEVLRRCISGAP